MNRVLLVNTVGSLLATSAAMAQTARFVDVSETHLPSGLPHVCMDAAIGDVDSDGDIDLALAMEREPNVLLLNDGNGYFRDASDQIPRTIGDSEDTEFVDVDGDGDLDLVFVSENNPREDNELYLNDGRGRFMNASERLPVKGISNALAVLDLSGDGALDLLIGNYGPEGVMINDGRGYFSDQTERYWTGTSGDTQDLELVDVDGDGDLDVLVANEGPNQLYLNEGGRLVDATKGRLPVRDDESREFRAADVDADGDMDLILVNITLRFNWPREDFLFLNDGSGRFTAAPADHLPSGERDYFTVQTIDVDDDRDLDVILPSSMFDPDTGDYRVLLNDGRGRFTPAPEGSVLPTSVNDRGIGFDIQAADFNGDERDDLFFCNRTVPRTEPLIVGRPSLLLRGAVDNHR